MFFLPSYHHPDFSCPALQNAPDVQFASVEQDGVAPEYYHSTSMYPEYLENDIIIIRSDYYPTDGDDIVVSINSSEILVKQKNGRLLCG